MAVNMIIWGQSGGYDEKDGHQSEMVSLTNKTAKALVKINKVLHISVQHKLPAFMTVVISVKETKQTKNNTGSLMLISFRLLKRMLIVIMINDGDGDGDGDRCYLLQGTSKGHTCAHGGSGCA